MVITVFFQVPFISQVMAASNQKVMNAVTKLWTHNLPRQASMATWKVCFLGTRFGYHATYLLVLFIDYQLG
jgi:hypothetical protein